MGETTREMRMVGAFARVNVFVWIQAEVRALVSGWVWEHVGTTVLEWRRMQVREWVRENVNVSGRVVEMYHEGSEGRSREKQACQMFALPPDKGVS